jgi:hypothetical protein
LGFAGQGLTGGLSAGCIDASGGQQLKVQVPYSAGEWTVAVERPILGGTTVSGQMRIVSIYDRSGTV